MDKPWTLKPVLKWPAPKNIANAIERIFGGDRRNAYQKLVLIGPTEDESDYDVDMILVTKYLRDQGFTEDSILVDNTW